MAIWETEQGQPDSIQAPPIAEMVDWKKQNHVFEDIGLTSDTQHVTLSGLGEPEPIHVQYSTPSFFSVLGVRPAVGRIFLAEEMQDTTQTVVISNSFWKRKFNRDPNVLGKIFNVDGVVSTVVGSCLRASILFTEKGLMLWIPIDPANARYSERVEHWLMPIARLKPGVTIADAQLKWT